MCTYNDINELQEIKKIIKSVDINNKVLYLNSKEMQKLAGFEKGQISSQLNSYEINQGFKLILD